MLLCIRLRPPLKSRHARIVAIRQHGAEVISLERSQDQPSATQDQHRPSIERQGKRLPSRQGAQQCDRIAAKCALVASSGPWDRERRAPSRARLGGAS